MDDFTKIYKELYDLNRRIYEIEETHKEEVYTKMTKIIEFNINYNGGRFTVNKLTAGDISQYERAVIKATLVGFPATDGGGDPKSYAVRFHISSPEHATLTETSPEDFEFHNYMTPQIGTKNSFLINLNTILGRKLKIGEQNACPLMFEVFDEGSSGHTDVSGINLYRTNISQTYSSDDLSAIFVKLNELSERQHELEAIAYDEE